MQQKRYGYLLSGRLLLAALPGICNVEKPRPQGRGFFLGPLGVENNEEENGLWLVIAGIAKQSRLSMD